MTINNISKWNYGSYASNNYGNHTTAIRINERFYYFSYDTLIAFRGTNSKGKFFDVIIKNYWGNTTGKHLNWINSDKKIRVDAETFKTLLNEFEQ